MDTLEYSTRLFASGEIRPSYHGTRNDGMVCDARPGECRYNYKYHRLSSGLYNSSAWLLHIADEGCNLTCPYLKGKN
jgi:hypothetical protein